MDEEEEVDIILEVLEVAINQILFLREVYPLQVFKKRCAYNAPVFISIYPPLNAYIQKALRMAKELRTNGKLERVELVFYQNESEIFERYVFDILQPPEAASVEDDEFLLDFEEQLRSSLYTMAERLKGLTKLPKDVKFNILLHTTQVGFVQVTNSPHYQEFPWVRYDMQKAETGQTLSILPLTSFNSIGLQMLAEVKPQSD